MVDRYNKSIQKYIKVKKDAILTINSLQRKLFVPHMNNTTFPFQDGFLS
jgi:hypothetical protein